MRILSEVDQRIRKLNEMDARTDGEYVLYWMRWNRRATGNHALAFASDLANRLELPLLVFENLDCEDRYANERRHTFILEGVAETTSAIRKLGAGYQFHLARRKGEEPRAWRHALAKAGAVVTDDFPDMLDGKLPKFDVQAYAVDASCVVPMSCIETRCYAAYSIRPKIQKLLAEYLRPAPVVKLRKRFAGAAEKLPDVALVQCEIDHTVPPSTTFHGGRKHAELHLERFLENRLRRYTSDKNNPSAHATSDLSPYLHFGFISALEVALAVGRHAKEHKLMADAFLEELIVRRELAFNFSRYSKKVDSLDELPEWARATLDKHRKDAREHEYTVKQFESAETYDDLWNATQKELLLRGKIHGYYRMYWGKKIIEWSPTPEEALATMIHLHDRYALDGQDPNTYGNILWCFGLHDRPWNERPIFGMVRWMSRGGMDRKTKVGDYLKEIEYLERTGKELIA